MADLDKTDPLASMLGDGYTNLDKAGKVAAAGSFLKSRDEAEKAARGEAGKRAEGQLISEFGPSLYSKPYEEFKPSQESMSGFAALGSLMMVAGTMMGSKGRLAGIGAMNNIAGMLKGYQSGRKDLYEQERQQFEENMKIQERNRADIKEAFNLALKMAPSNLRGAEDFLNKTFASKGMTMPQAMLKTSGVMHTIGTVNGALDRADDITKKIADSLGYKGVTSRKDLEARIAAQTAGTAAQVASRKAEETGTPEYGVITYKDGTKESGLFPSSKIYEAQKTGASFEKLAAPSAKSEAAVDKQYVQDRAKRIALYLEKPLSTWDRRKADGQEIEKILARDYPQYDEKKYVTRTAAQKAFATGKEAATSRSLEVVFDHLATLDDLNDARNAGDIQRFNRIAASWAAQFGATAPTNFETAVSQIGAEVTKAIGGAGYTGALTDREEARSAFDIAKTPEQVTGAIATVKRLVGGQLKGIGDQYERTTGEKFANSNILPDTILKDMGWTSRIFKDGKSPEPAPATSTVPSPSATATKQDPATLPPATKDQISFTAKKYGKTEDQIKDILRAQGRKIEGE